jgi:hypothetical protein
VKIRYYDIPGKWTKRIQPHLGDEHLNQIIIRDFNKYTYGRWRRKFMPGMFPADFESCLWDISHRGRKPRYWRYVKHAACHWLVNFNLRLAQLAEPSHPWRILTSQDHSTVWDGDAILFDMNFLALGVAPDEAFTLASEKELPIGKQLRTYFAEHFSVDVKRLAEERAGGG